MEKEFEEFLDLVKKNIDKCPFVTHKTIEKYHKHIKEEADEVMQAAKHKDYENLKEELGDLFWDVAVLAYIAEKEGHFKAEDIIISIKDKMKRRKPWLLEERKISHEEAERLWFEAKAKEKENGN